MTISRSTDTLGRDTGFLLDKGYEVSYAYDMFGRFHSVSSSVASAPSVATYSYLPGTDLISGMTNSAGFHWSRAYEPQRDLIASVENVFNAETVSRFDYLNTAIAMRTRRVDTLGGSALPVTNAFANNMRGELTAATMGTNSYAFAYDPIGNRLASTNNLSGWVYYSNPLNQYTLITNRVNHVHPSQMIPTYDLAGNMTYDGQEWHYVWNGENRLIRIESLPSVPDDFKFCIENEYDHMGRRVSKTVKHDYSMGSYTATNSTTYIWNAWDLVCAMSSNGFTNYYVGGTGCLLSMTLVTNHDAKTYFYC